MARRERNVALSGSVASVAKSARTLGNPRSHAGALKKRPTGEPVDLVYWWWDGTPHQTTIESTESKRCGLLRTSADSIEKAVGVPFGGGRSSRFFALIGHRKGRSTSSAFRGQFNSRNGNRTRVPQSLSAGRTKPHGHCRADQACRARPVPGSAASACCGWPRSV
jgi:hypothetical protein